MATIHGKYELVGSIKMYFIDMIKCVWYILDVRRKFFDQRKQTMWCKLKKKFNYNLTVTDATNRMADDCGSTFQTRIPI